LNGLLSQYLAGDLQVDAASLLAFFKTILDRMDVDIKTKLETNEVFLAAINKTMAQYKTFLLKKDVVDNSNEPSPTIH
jgi:hypothetical protein